MTLTKDTKFYECDEPCEFDGTFTRYLNNNGCKVCVKRRNAKHEAKNIKARWEIGEPCEDCGGNRFYKKSGACFECSTTEAVKKKTVNKIRTVDDDIADIINGFIKGKWQAI